MFNTPFLSYVLFGGKPFDYQYCIHWPLFDNAQLFFWELFCVWRIPISIFKVSNITLSTYFPWEACIRRKPTFPQGRQAVYLWGLTSNSAALWPGCVPYEHVMGLYRYSWDQKLVEDSLPFFFLLVSLCLPGWSTSRLPLNSMILFRAFSEVIKS